MSALIIPQETAPEGVAAAAGRLRGIIGAPHSPAHAAAVLGAALAQWRHHAFAPRREAVAQIARRRGFSEPLLDASLDALLEPFRTDALHSFAARTPQHQALLGFVMAGNVAGAGLHEVAISLIAGAGLIIKTASAEPILFRSFVQTLAEHDPALAARIAIFTWPREDAQLTAVLRESCDAMVVYGDDATIASLTGNRPLFAFGSRLSGAVATRGAIESAGAQSIAAGFARDATLFEQLGCLSPHHVFVQAPGGLDFAGTLAQAMDELARALPPPTFLEIEDSVALRIARERARWRGLGGEPVRIFEGANLAWTLIYDRDADFTASPGLRTVHVSEFNGLDDLRARLDPARGYLEAFSAGATDTEAPRLGAMLGALGVSHFAAPGRIQSPPVTWRHGGGKFLDWITRQG